MTMTQEEKLKLAKQVMQVAGIFSLVVAGILLINFIQLKSNDPLESDTMTFLVEQLKDDPHNDVLMEEIRKFDLLVRKAYFTTEWQVKTGTWLLLFGGILFGFALKVYTDIRRKIEVPGSYKEAFIKARENTYKWLLGAGILIFAGALAAGFSGTNYLDNYMPDLDIANVNESSEQGIEVVRIKDASGSAVEGGDSVVENSDQSDVVQEVVSEGKTENAGASEPGTVAAEKVYGEEEFRKQHNTFRGPMGLGVSYHKNIPTSWDGASGTNILWKVAISKPGYNSPVIWGDKIFLAGGDKAARVVSCFNRNTGELLWEHEVKDIQGSPASMPKVSEDTGLSAPTAAVDGYRVYVIFATGDIIAFSLDGKRIWARNLGVPENHYGHSSSLMVWNKKVIVQYDTGKAGRMLALNTLTGETVWDVKRNNHISWASPILVKYDGKVQVVTNTDPLVAGHDVETGAEIWSADVMMGEVGSSCAYEEGLVFANNEYASLVALEPKPGTTPSWEAFDYLSEAASPVAYNGLLFLATSYGVVACYETKTGKEVWNQDFGAPFYSSPMVVEGKLYLMDNTGVMHIMKADRTGEVISQPVLGENSYAVPAFADGRIYIRGEESLYCVGEQ